MSLTQRDIRTIKFGAVCAAAIMAFTFGSRWLEDWNKVRADLGQLRGKLNDINIDQRKQEMLLAVVPVFEMPKPEQEQKFLFRDKLNEQLKKAGVNSGPLQIMPSRASAKFSGHRVLPIKCSGKCKLDQLFDLLLSLKENPYILRVDELKIECDTKKKPEERQEVDFNMTVSTLVALPAANQKEVAS